MKVAAAYMLCVLGGNAAPTAADVTKVISAAGAEAEEATVSTLMTDLEGKDINEILAAGIAKVTDCAKNASAGAPAAAAGGAAPAAAAAAAAPAAKPVEEVVDALEGGMNMFGGGDGGDY